MKENARLAAMITDHDAESCNEKKEKRRTREDDAAATENWVALYTASSAFQGHAFHGCQP